MLSGKYDDDFESTLTDATVDQFDGQTTSSDTANAATCRPVPEERESDSAESTDAESEETEGGDDTLTVSFDDIGVLRRSLERDEMIRESLASNPKWVSV